MMVVGGTFREWADLGDDRWMDRVEQLGAAVAAAGGSWLTLRAYRDGHEAGDRDVDDALRRWTRDVPVHDHGPDVASCTVIVDPCADGRRRFAEAMASLDPDTVVNEAVVAHALYDPADCEPDAVLVLGPSTRLPPSLVWELAYAELVFEDVAWDALGPEHVTAAIDDFAGRRRRFGGLDS